MREHVGSRPRARHVRLRTVRPANRVRATTDPEIERARQSERARLAAAIDTELHVACGSEAAARHDLGRAAHKLLARRGHQRLGFVTLGDYGHERLGVSGRTLQYAAWVAARLEALPLVEAAFDRRELSWTQVRALCRVATMETQTAWLDRARRCSARQLELLATSIEGGGASPPDPEGDDGVIDGEPAVRFRLACPARVRVLWRHACELASRMAGASLVPWRAAETIAAEAFSGRPADGSYGDRALLAALRPRKRAWRRASEDRASEGRVDEVRAQAERDAGSTGDAGTGGAGSCDAARSAAAAVPCILPARVPRDPFALDARLCEAMRTIRTTEPRIGHLLRLVVDLKLYRSLGCATVEAYVRERLGISARKAWALLKIEKTAQRTSAFHRQYREGSLPWTRAVTLLPVIDRTNEDAWLARASAVTAQRLADEVGWVLEWRDVLGPQVALDPPPLDHVLVSAVAATLTSACQKMAPTARTQPTSRPLQNGAPDAPALHPSALDPPSAPLQDGAHRFELCDAEICFTGPASVVALLRDTMDAFACPGEPRWRAFEAVVRHALVYWERVGRHRDPVFARDGWRCAVPACSARRNLHDHHLHYRSRGGGNEQANRVAICAAHHLHGIHGGAVRAWGTAPHPVYWQLGLRSGGRPLLSYVGDRVWSDRMTATGETADIT